MSEPTHEAVSDYREFRKDGDGEKEIVRLRPMKIRNQMKPHAVFRGDKPRKGSTLTFTLENGVTYAGKVLAAETIDGETIVEFDGALEVTK
ncbi:hypothetical protein [Frigidibacter sp. MR17.24]|uniref:hypothetical protein n=1 Tax=Frigidibacter sp. MR17.24 TaxID=3127345 RepID=UPI003012E150